MWPVSQKGVMGQNVGLKIRLECEKWWLWPTSFGFYKLLGISSWCW